MPVPVVLQAQGLRKAYGPRTAVADVSFEVRAGEVLGLLGPNGAGKSTTVGMISGTTTPDAGRITVGGLTLADDALGYRRRIGLVPQDLALYEDLPAQANVELFGALYGLAAPQLKRRAAEVIAMVGLTERARDKPSTFSGGMKRRLNIACALVHEPDVLLLDEPTAGVDPQSRNAIFDNLESLKRAGMALVYTTHYMEEVERLADRVVIVDHGRVVAEGTLSELLRVLPAAQTLQFEVAGPVPADALRALPGVQSVRIEGETVHVGMGELLRDGSAVMQLLAGAGVSLRQVSSGRTSLEDVFLALTGRQLRD